MKRIRWSFFLAVLALAACSSGGDSLPSTQQSKVPSDTSANAPTQAPVNRPAESNQREVQDPVESDALGKPSGQADQDGRGSSQGDGSENSVNERTYDISCVDTALGTRVTDEIVHRGRVATSDELAQMEPCKLFVPQSGGSVGEANESNNRATGRMGEVDGDKGFGDALDALAPPSDQQHLLADWGPQRELCKQVDKDDSGTAISPRCNVIPIALDPGVTRAVLRKVELPSAKYGTPGSHCQVLRGDICDELRWGPVSDLRAGEFVQIRIAPTNPDVMYAGTDSNDMTIYRSTDGGDTWELVHVKGHAAGIAISPVDSNVVLYTNLEAPVQLTRDGGDSWESVVGNEPQSAHYNNPFTAISFSTDHPNIAYTAALRGSSRGGIWPPEPTDLFKSTDSGATWQQTGTCLTCSSIQSLVVKPGDPNFIWVAADGGLQYSQDSGQTWSGNVIPYLQEVAKQSGNDNMMSMPKVIGLAIHPDRPNIVLAASTEFGMFRSIDAGISWNHSNTGLNTSKLHQVQFAPGNPNVAYLTAHDGIYRSDDGGKSWVERNGELKYRFLSPLAIHPRDEDVIFVGSTSEIYTIHPEHINRGFHEGHGLFKSVDGGMNWTRSDTGITEAKPAQLGTHPLFPFNIWVGGESGRGNLFSPDGGENWLFSPSITSHYPMVYAFNYVLPTVVYATGWLRTGELAASTDGGASWYHLTHKLEEGLSAETRQLGLRAEGPSDFHIHAVAVAPSDPDVIYVGSVNDTVYPDLTFNLDGAHIWKSSDHGETFQEMSNGFPIETKTSINAIIVHPTDPRIAYAMTSLHETETAIGIYKTTDGAESWFAVNEGLDPFTNDLQIDPINPEILYAATESGVYKTINGGKAWYKTSNGISPDPVIDMAIDPLNPLVLYAITPDSLYQTRDGADHWYAVNSGLPLLKDDSSSMSVQERLFKKLKLDRTKTGHSVYGGTFAQDRTLEIDATGRVIVVVVKTNRSDEDRRNGRLLYRAVRNPLIEAVYEFSVNEAEVNITSQSNIYNMSFDAGRRELRFVAGGPPGTRSRTTLIVDATLLSGVVEVLVDGQKVSSSVTTSGVSYEHVHSGLSDVIVRGR